MKNSNTRKYLNKNILLVFIGIILATFTPFSAESQTPANVVGYPALIQTADQALAAKDYPTALMQYEKAKHAKPELTYASGKIAEINTILDANADLRAQLFESSILKAENFYAQKAYPQAKTEYQKALVLDPSAQYPKDKIRQVSSIYTDPSDQVYFNDAVANGDKALTVFEYEKAILFYETALAVKPDSRPVKEKISTTRKLQEEHKIKSQQATLINTAADKLLQSGKRIEAKTEFQKTLSLIPNNAYAQQKIKEIEAYDLEKQKQQDNFDKVIDQADQFYISRDFANAHLKYQEALKIKPTARYPKDMLEKTKSGESQLLTEQQKYEAAIASGDNMFAKNDYETALIGYKSALTIKPTESYPNTKIAEIEKILGTQTSNKAAYDLAIANGNQLVNEKKYDAAMNQFRTALSLFPNEKYPAEKISEITANIGQQKTADENFKKAVAEADKLFALKKYSEAISQYTLALSYKPDETYAQQRIAEAQSQLATAKNKEENYTSAINRGDEFVNALKYAEALSEYKQALILKPTEKYPKAKVDEITQILAKSKTDAEKYNAAIANGDKAFIATNLTLALTSFQEALKIKPAEQYPQDKINEINTLLSAQAKNNELYKTAIANGDKFLAAKEFKKALSSYTEASTIKQNEKYPADQIAKINKALGDLRTTDENYTQAITEGDNNFIAGKYAESLAFFKKASGIKPTENYPKAQTEKINKLLVEQEKLNDEYSTLLASADQKFDTKKYPEAIADYRKALELKASEKYPNEKIAESEQRIADLKTLQENYEKAITEGTDKLTAKAYDEALLAFKQANSLKPSESLPSQKIREIQTILDKITAENTQYKEAIARADKFYADKKYPEALEPYQLASTIKPNEKYAQEQIFTINQLLADQKKQDEEYQKLLTEAETLLRDKKYSESRFTYTNAGLLKPSEELPNKKIAEIDTILENIKRIEEKYAKAIQTASEQYMAKNLVDAVKLYEEALALKPLEKHPEERITAIKAELKTIDDNYFKAITAGDSKMAAQNLMDALNAYQHALEIKPGEAYPKSKITEINSALSAQKEQQEKLYASYIADGDKLLEGKDYAGSKSAFTKATGIKPEETYPKIKITELDKIIEEMILARRAEYTKALGEADKLYNSKVFDQAIDAYETAGKINPDDAYPQLQISKIRKYMVDHAIQDLFSQAFVISEGNEKKFSFSAIEPRLRKNNYILLKARSTGKTAPKVYLNYGKDGQKNGAIVLRSLTKTETSDYVIRLSVQDKWYREDNNWISLFVETGDVEITKVQIAAGDE